MAIYRIVELVTIFICQIKHHIGHQNQSINEKIQQNSWNCTIYTNTFPSHHRLNCIWPSQL